MNRKDYERCVEYGREAARSGGHESSSPFKGAPDSLQQEAWLEGFREVKAP